MVLTTVNVGNANGRNLAGAANPAVRYGAKMGYRGRVDGSTRLGEVSFGGPSINAWSGVNYPNPGVDKGYRSLDRAVVPAPAGNPYFGSSTGYMTRPAVAGLGQAYGPLPLVPSVDQTAGGRFNADFEPAAGITPAGTIPVAGYAQLPEQTFAGLKAQFGSPTAWNAIAPAMAAANMGDIVVKGFDAKGLDAATPYDMLSG